MRFFCDLGGDVRSSILVAGSGRSGTTWLGETVAALTGAREIFEPILIDGDMDIATPKRWKLNYPDLLRNYLPYVRPDAGRESRYFQALDAIFRGRMRNRWCDGGVRPGLYRQRVIKDIRANLALAYIAEQWPGMRILWIVRDPRAVVASQLGRFGYDFEFGPQSVVFQPKLTADWLADHVAAIDAAASKAERLAHRWCVETMVPLWQGVHRRANVLLVRYDALKADPSAWAPVLSFIGQDEASAGRLAAIQARRSRTAGDGEPRTLAAEDMAAVERIVEGYGAAAWMAGDASLAA